MDNTKIRGNIHVLLIGDPSTGKSQLLKAVQSAICPGLYVSGKGSSAAGLTACVDRWVARFHLAVSHIKLASKGKWCACLWIMAGCTFLVACLAVIEKLKGSSCVPEPLFVLRVAYFVSMNSIRWVCMSSH